MNASQICWISNEDSRHRTNFVDYGVRDAKGRAIGGYAVIQPSHREDAPYFVKTRATRDGETFGAIVVRGTYAATLEEAKAIGAKKLEAAAKRYRRQAEKAARSS